MSIFPYRIERFVSVDGADKFREFVKYVFDATMTYEDTAPDGTIGHCEASIGGSIWKYLVDHVYCCGDVNTFENRK